MINIQQLRYRWPGAGSDVLAIDALTIPSAQSVFLYGPSGCGKSTLLALLAGVLVPDSGTVSVLGQSWAALPSGRRDAARAERCGVIFQQFNLLPYLSLVDNVLLPCRFSVLRRARALTGASNLEAAAQSLLQRVALPPALWLQPAARLSVGQQQRVAAARALIGTPPVVIADEPTSALDAALREDFMALLMGECRAAGSTLVFVSHDERLADRFDVQLSLPSLNKATPT